MRSIDSCISSAACSAITGAANIAIRPSPSVLTTMAAEVLDDARGQRDALRHDGGRLGVAERLVQGGAAPEVGEQDRAFDDLGHGITGIAMGPKFIATV